MSDVTPEARQIVDAVGDRQTETTADGNPKDEPRVPYARFEAEQQKRLEADKQLKALTDRLEELEAAGKSETEQERIKRERAERRLSEMEADLKARDERLNRMEKSSWVRNAAAQANFANPDDAVAFAELDSIEDPKDADKAIKKLSEQRPYLLRQESPSSQLGQVLGDGRTPQPGQVPDRSDDEQFLSDLRAALDKGQVSTPGLLDQ